MIKFKIEENKDSIKNEEEFKDSDLDISININIKPCKSEKLKIGKKYYERIGRKNVHRLSCPRKHPGKSPRTIRKL